MKKKTFPFTGAWYQAFGTPEMSGVWFVWGNSGNGKSSLVMQMCRELARYCRVAYNSLEEGTSLTTQENLIRFNMAEAGRNFQVIQGEPIAELSERLKRHKAPHVVVIDSFQYTQLNYKSYIKFKEKHSNKLLVFVSHADGKNPAGRSARSVMYDAALKIWVEGYIAFSKGRFIGPLGKYTVWEKGAYQYWGMNEENELVNK